jgi:hypothetical protein
VENVCPVFFFHSSSKHTDQRFEDTVLVIEYGEFGNYRPILLSWRY